MTTLDTSLFIPVLAVALMLLLTTGFHRFRSWNGGWASFHQALNCTGTRTSGILPTDQFCSQMVSTITLRSFVAIIRSSFLFHPVNQATATVLEHNLKASTTLAH